MGKIMLKNKNNFKLKSLITAILTTSTIYSYAANVEQNDNGITFNSLEQSHYSLTVISPNKERYSFDINQKDFILTAEMLNQKSFDDGLYKYELTPNIKTGNLGNDVRALENSQLSQEFKDEFSSSTNIHSGTFSISQNKLLQDIEEVSTKDSVINDDLIVDGSACIGFDCVNGESFGFDTIRLKENNLRIKFDDTSGVGSFPNVDWQLTANDSANGGANKFSIDDITNSRTIFTVEANAPSHSLYVDDGGRVGLGTSTPSVEMHIINGDTATLRLEQNGSSGFAPQVWDVAGNETNFFVRDVSNGSTLPFRIRPGAPTSSIFIDVDGDVSIGDASPEAPLNVVRSNGTAQVLVEENSGTQAVREMFKMVNNGGSYITMENSAASNKAWFLTHENSAGNSFNITHSDSGGAAMRLTTDGNMTILGSITTTGGTCGGGCDLVFSEDYNLPTIEEHESEMWSNRYLPAVGPTIENAPINISDKTGRMLNELEKAHIYIAQLNKTIKSKSSELDEMKDKYDSLEQRLSKLEIK